MKKETDDTERGIYIADKGYRMWCETNTDDTEVKCEFCKKIVKPILKRNIWTLGKLVPLVGWWRVKRAPPKKWVRICPNCKALIGAKD